MAPDELLSGHLAGAALSGQAHGGLGKGEGAGMDVPGHPGGRQHPRHGRIWGQAGRGGHL